MTYTTKKKLLKQILNLETNLTIGQIVELTGYTWEELNISRLRCKVVWRQLIMSYLYANGMTLQSIGEKFGKDHATVIHAIESFINLHRWNDELSIETLNKVKCVFELKMSKSTLTDRLLSKHYTSGTGVILDYETRIKFDWVADAINEALKITE